LTNGNYVVGSSNWNNNTGAATWGNGSTGVSGTISSTNSLIGSSANDFVSSHEITALTNGNYVVSSPNWDNGSITNGGAATWGNGSTGVRGVVSSTNSLVGSTANDRVGGGGISYFNKFTALSNGNYVVISPSWDNGTITDVGAATWGNGTKGISGIVSTVNSLTGSATNDFEALTVKGLSNGNYVVSSGSWDNNGLVDTGQVRIATPHHRTFTLTTVLDKP
jgi:hypothetical protein